MNKSAVFWQSAFSQFSGHRTLCLFLLILFGFSGSALAQSAGAPLPQCDASDEAFYLLRYTEPNVAHPDRSVLALDKVSLSGPVPVETPLWQDVSPTTVAAGMGNDGYIYGIRAAAADTFDRPMVGGSWDYSNDHRALHVLRIGQAGTEDMGEIGDGSFPAGTARVFDPQSFLNFNAAAMDPATGHLLAGIVRPGNYDGVYERLETLLRIDVTQSPPQLVDIISLTSALPGKATGDFTVDQHGQYVYGIAYDSATGSTWWRIELATGDVTRVPLGTTHPSYGAAATLPSGEFAFFSNSGALAVFDATGSQLRSDNTTPAESADAARCLLPAPTTVYVDDDFSGSGFYAPVSFGGNPAAACSAASATFGHDAFGTITDALAHVADGGTVCVAAGTYAETNGTGSNLIINKPVSIYGAQAGLDARNRSDTGASSIIPAVGVPNLGYDDSDGTIVEINSDGVVLDGFVLDGDNPAITTGLAMGAADPDVAVGIIATGSDTQIRNNVIRNLVYAGIFGLSYPTTLPAANNNVIAHNWIQNLDAPSSWGIAIVVGYNFYADIDSNLLDDVRIGIQTNYYNKPAAAGTDAFIRNNEVHASQLGIYFHYFAQTSSPFTVSGNQIFANANPASTAVWSGVMVSSFLSDSFGLVQSNAIDASALAGSGRLRAGYQVVLISTIHADDLSIDGGSVSNVDDGVLVTDGAYFAGPVNNITVRNVAFSNVARAAFHVEDTLMVGAETTDHSPKITIGTGNTFSGVAYQGALTGPLATIAYAPSATMLETLLVRAAGQGHRGGLADSKGNVREAANALINAGITAVASGGTVGVESGTFAENVLANKPVTLLGPHAGVHGNDAARGTGESLLTQAVRGTGLPLTVSASNVTVDGFMLGQTTGHHMVLVSDGVPLANVKFINNRLHDFISDWSAASGLQVAQSTGIEIAGNWFGEFANGTSGRWAVGARLNDAVDSHVHDNVFWNVQSVHLQVNRSHGSIIERNTMDAAAAPGSGNAGIQVHGNDDVVVRNNSIAHVDSGLLITPDNTSSVTLYCNTVTNSTRGLYAMGNPYPGTHVIGPIFHNRIEASTPIQTNWGLGELVVGSNYYGAGTASSPVALIADPLANNPIGNAACGDNSPTSRVVLSGTPQSTMAGTAFPAPLQLRFTDALGGAAVGQAVGFTAPTSGPSAVLSGTSVLTDYNGVAGVTATANAQAGNYLVEASAGGLSPALFNLTNTKSTGTVNFAPLTAPYATAHAVTATMSPADTNVICTAVSGVPAQAAAPGNYLVSASCEGDNYVATGTATYVVTASTAAIGPVSGSAPVGVVTVDPLPDPDSKKSYFSWVINGSAGENVVAEFVIGTGNASPHASDLTVEYLEIIDNSWQPLPLSFDTGTGTWAGVFGTATGFALTDGTQSQFRATFQRGGRYITTASLVGVSSGLTLATSQPVATDVADIDLVGSGNAAGVVGVAVDTGYALVNSGTAALSGGGTGNPIPAQPAPNDENVRGRFFIEWDGGALTPADPNGVGGNGSNCGAETCASPDIAVEFFDAASSSYQPIYNLRAELDGSNQPTGRLYGHFGAASSGGVPVPAGYSGTYLFRTTSKTHTGNYTVVSQVVGIDTGTVYAQAPVQTIAIDTGNAASIEIIGDDFGVGVVGGIAYGINMDGSLRVLVRDSGGNPVDGASVAFNAPVSGASAVLSAGSCTTDASGECQITVETNTVAGTFVVEASIANGQHVEFDLTNYADTDPGQVEITIVSGDAQTAPVDGTYGLPLVAKVTDRFGNPLEGLDVQFSAPASGASVSPASVSTTSDIDGLVASGTFTANSIAGAVPVSATVDAGQCTSTLCSASFMLQNSVANVSISDIVWADTGATSIAYDGSAKSATATVTGSSLIPNFTYNGSSTAPSNAGSYQVIATIDDGNVYGTASAMLTITPAAVGDSGIDLTGGSFTYDGSYKPATVANPNGVAYALTYDTGNGLPPVNVGTYTATLTVNDPNHAVETLTATIEITPAAVELSFGNLSHVYDGTVKTATVTTSPAGVTGVSLAYDATPVDAGSYTVTASLSNPNFTLTGPTEATLVINRATAQIFLSGLNHVFDGTVKSATVTTVPAALAANVVVTYTPASPINVGSYAVEASLVGQTNYADTTVTGTLTIVAATVAGFEIDGADTFNGVAGEALTAPLPTVRVFDTANNGVAGISVSFQVTAGGGSILGNVSATVTTDSSGLASVPEWMLGAIAGTNTMTASTGMAGLPTLSFNATGTQVADLTITKTVDRIQAHAGQVLTWTIEVENAGPSTVDAELLDAIPAGVDDIQWDCVDEGGASCGVIRGTGDISFTSTIPAGGRIIVVISATVTTAAPTGQPLVNEAAVNWQSQNNPETAVASASVGIVPAESGPCSIFCDGFEGAGRSIDLVGPKSSAQGPAHVGGWQLQPPTSGKPVPALELLDAHGSAVAWVDVIVVGNSQRLRLRQLDAKGAERASAWFVWSANDVLGYQWDQSMDGLMLQFRPLTKAGGQLELQLPPGTAIPQRVRLLSAVSR